MTPTIIVDVSTAPLVCPPPGALLPPDAPDAAGAEPDAAGEAPSDVPDGAGAEPDAAGAASSDAPDGAGTEPGAKEVAARAPATALPSAEIVMVPTGDPRALQAEVNSVLERKSERGRSAERRVQKAG